MRSFILVLLILIGIMVKRTNQYSILSIFSVVMEFLQSGENEDGTSSWTDQFLVAGAYILLLLLLAIAVVGLFWLGTQALDRIKSGVGWGVQKIWPSVQFRDPENIKIGIMTPAERKLAVDKLGMTGGIENAGMIVISIGENGPTDVLTIKSEKAPRRKRKSRSEYESGEGKELMLPLLPAVRSGFPPEINSGFAKGLGLLTDKFKQVQSSGGSDECLTESIMTDDKKYRCNVGIVSSQDEEENDDKPEARSEEKKESE